MTLEEMWDCLNVEHGVSEQTLQVVTNINGYNEDTMRIHPIRSLLIVGGFALFLQLRRDASPPSATRWPWPMPPISRRKGLQLPSMLTDVRNGM